MISKSHLNKAIALREKIEEMENDLKDLLSGKASVIRVRKSGKRVMTKEGREAIAKAQRLRHKKARQEKKKIEAVAA